MKPNLQNEANRRAYEAIAGIYAGTEPGEDDPAMREICRSLFASKLRGKRILEIGCGPGVDSARLQEMGFEVTATDFCDSFVQIVRERFPKVLARKMDMTNPDLPDGSFDGIYGFASFIHVPRSAAGSTLKRLWKLLRPQGILFLSMIDSNKVRDYVVQDWGGRENNPVLFTCYAKEEAERILRSVGFTGVEFHAIRSELYEKLPRLVERGVTGYQVVATRD
jgi:2-polyprenyl-3-methyl-5-hydroxy-6-metoxy-1,4-benzoquinol methylase